MVSNLTLAVRGDSCLARPAETLALASRRYAGVRLQDSV
jgi:hypothetical protein